MTTPDPRSRTDRARGPEPTWGRPDATGKRGGDDGSAGPFVIEFAGTPRAGKTTALNGLKPYLEAFGHRVSVIDERARDCPVPTKRHPHFNLWTASVTLAGILEARYAGSNVILVDRGLFDAVAWMEWFRCLGELSDGEHGTIDGYLRAPTLARTIDLVLVMTVAPSEALHRDHGGRPHPTPGPFINSGTLCTINEAIDAVMARNRPDDEFQLEHVDTTLMDAPATLHRVAEIVAGRLDRGVGLPGARHEMPVPLGVTVR